MKKEIENIEVLDLIKAREIVQEIMNFGVNDLQIKKIIKLLSLELSDRDVMISICDVLNEEVENKPKIEI